MTVVPKEPHPNLRMMALAGRWPEFWSRSDLPALLTRAFKPANDDDLSIENAA